MKKKIFYYDWYYLCYFKKINSNLILKLINTIKLKSNL